MDQSNYRLQLTRVSIEGTYALNYIKYGGKVFKKCPRRSHILLLHTHLLITYIFYANVECEALSCGSIH